MTLPASGAISIGAVNTEVGVAATTTKGLDWLKNNSDVASYSLGSYYSKKYYAKTTYACNNGNCSAANCWSGRLACNCGDCYGYTFSTCSVCGSIAATQTNCGAAKLQSDCSASAGTFNCNVCVLSGGGGGANFCSVCPPNYLGSGYWIYDCRVTNCNCCFVAGTMVVMDDGSLKAIEDIQVGDILFGGVEVAHCISSTLGNNTLWAINSETMPTGGHLFETDNGWKAADLSVYPNGTFYQVDADGEVSEIQTIVSQLTVGDICGGVAIDSIERVEADSNLPVFNLILVNGETFKLANGLIVDGFAKVNK